MSATASAPVLRSHPLLRRIRAIRRVARALMVARGVAFCVIAVVASAIVLGCVDWSWRWQSPFPRWVSSGGVIGALLLAARRWLMPTISGRMSVVDVAVQIEEQQLGLGDRLSSSVAFLETQASPAAILGPLESSTVDETWRRTRGLSFASAIDPWPTTIAWLCVFFVGASAFALSRWESSSFEHAARRLIQPWRPLPWPQRYHLQIDPLPEAIYSGDSLRVVVRDTDHAIPDDTRLLIRSSSGVETLALRQAGQAGVALLNNLESDLELRAIGGDDSVMDWRTVRIVQPLRVAKHQWTLQPPAYSGLPSRTLEASRMEVMAGTIGTLSVELTKPVRQARLVRVNSDAETPISSEAEIADTNGTMLRFEPIQFRSELELRLHWTDTDGIEGKSKSDWKIQVQSDATPRVAWDNDSPASMMTLAGSIALDWTAEDDFGLIRTATQWRQQQGAESEFNVLRELELSNTPLAASGSAVLKPAELQLREGDTIEIVAWAIDGAEQRGFSERRQLAIVSESVMLQEVAQRESAILDKLRDATAQQRSARDDVLSASSDLLDETREEAEVMRRLRVADAAQRQAIDQLNASQGAIQLSTQLLDMLRDNDLLDDASRQLIDLPQSLRTLSDGDLAGIAKDLKSTVESASSESASSLKQHLDQIAERQTDVADQLENLAGELKQRDVVRDLTRQLADLSNDQQRLQGATDRAGKEQASDARSDAQALATRQQDLSQRANKLGAQIDALQKEAAETQPMVADRLQRAAEQLRDGAVSEQMRQATSDLQAERFGQASRKQSEISRSLQATRDALAGTDRSREEALQDVVAEASDDLRNIADQQQQITRQLEEGDSSDSELQATWEKLAEQTDALQNRIERLNDQETSSQIASARQAQQQGQQELRRQQRDAAQAASQRAEERLADAQRQLQRMRQQLEQSEQRQAMWTFVERLEQVILEQQDLVKRLNNPTDDSIVEMADRQAQLAQQVRELATPVEQLAGFEFALQGAAADMDLVAANLAREDRTTRVIDTAAAVASRLQYVLDAAIEQLRESSSTPKSDDAEADDDEQQDAQNDHENRKSLLAGVRLLAGLQQWLNDRTKQVESIETNDDAQQAMKNQAIEDLARQQRELHEQFRALLQQQMELR
ncbi:MAG: DUF4175 family protein [Pirellulaceae bacterium]